MIIYWGFSPKGCNKKQVFNYLLIINVDIRELFMEQYI